MTTASTPRFTFAVWDLVDDHPDVRSRELGMTPHHVDVRRGARADSDTGQGVLVRSYDPASLIQARDDQPPPRSGGVGHWTGYGFASISSIAISELAIFPEVKERLHERHQWPHPRDTIMIVDGTEVPAVAWELRVGGMSVTVSASLLTHPVAVVTWRGRLTTPITLGRWAGAE